MLFRRDAVFTGTPEDLFMLAVGAAFTALAVSFFARKRRPGSQGYDVVLAWLRAGMYFCTCLFASWATGVLHTVLNAPLFTSEQTANTNWLLLTAGCLLVEIIGYWIIWPIGTFTLERERHVPAQAGFGFVWGVCEAQLFLSFWALVEMLGLPTMYTALITFCVLSGFQGSWHSLYWDIHVAPEHNIPAWNKWKVLFAHVPNLIITLTHLALFENAGLFILFQTVSLVGSTIFMRFPLFWRAATQGNTRAQGSEAALGV